jgi:hypothetical protein
MKKIELRQIIKEEIRKSLTEDSSKKNRFLGIFGPSKDIFQRIIKNTNPSEIEKLIKYTESNGDSVERIDKNVWGITKESGKNNQTVWQYYNGDLYFENPNFPSLYDAYIRKTI